MNKRPALPPYAQRSVRDEAGFDDFCQHTLAPVLNEYLARLHSTVLAALANQVRPLFCYRAGLRIHYLYQQWLAARGSALPDGLGHLKTSRLAALKAGYAGAPTIALTGIGTQLPGLDTQAVVTLLLGQDQLPPETRLGALPLHEFIVTEHPVAALLRAHLEQQSALMATTLQRLSGGSERLLLIDSGWAGSTQLILEQAFPAYRFSGCYLGTLGRASILDRQVGSMQGLLFEQADGKFDPAQPATILSVHRHLIESLLEPDLPSVTQLSKADAGRAARLPSSAAIAARGADWDQVFDAVCAAVVASARQAPATRLLAYQQALERLHEVLLYPDAAAANLAQGKYRSSDMGRDSGLYPLLSPTDRHPGDSPARRIRQALWAPGQAALEYPDPQQRRAVQQQLALTLSVAARSDYFVAASGAARTLDAAAQTVAIITRTKDRPLLLQRAAASVAAQTWTQYEWVIVNDGGDLDSVLATVEASLADPSQVTICHNPRSLGMEAASNTGIAHSRSEWLVIHDDDDSWHPEFLARSTAFLLQHRQLYRGVICGTIYVEEEIIGQQVVERLRSGYQEWVRSVHLSEMATGNFFAPIAFLYERAVYDAIGGYDPQLPVLGDWDFNLRFLLEADIGVLAPKLAYYHHRLSQQGGSYSNSVVGGVDKHIAYNAIVRNKYTRLGAHDPRMATLATLTAQGYLQLDTRGRLDRLQQRISGIMEAVNGLQESSAPQHQQWLDEQWLLMCTLAEQVARISNGTLTAQAILALPADEVLRLTDISTVPVPPDFDEEAYLHRYPDVASGIQAGAFCNGYVHYLKFGRLEGRARPRLVRTLR